MSLRSLLGGARDLAPVSFTPRTGLPWVGSAAISRMSRTAQLESMGTAGTLFAIVSRLATSVAGNEWKMYRKRAPGSDPDAVRVEVSRHAALDVWNRPNAFFTRQELVEVGQQHHELTGETWFVIGRNPRSPIPLELWPVRPDRIAPVPSPESYLSGYMYTGPDGEEVPLGIDEVIFMRSPNPMDPYRGMGPVQALLVDLDSMKYSAEWNLNFFYNSAEPGGIIEAPRELSDSEFRTLMERWRESHKGVARAHRVAILEGMKYIPTGQSMKDMDFANLRNVSREIVREAFGFPKPMLGTTEDVNLANAKAGEYVFARWLVKDRLDRLKGALNNDFLRLFGTAGEGVEFDYVSPVPADREADNAELTARVSAAVALIGAGFEPAAALETVGLPPMMRAQVLAAVPAADPFADPLAPSEPLAFGGSITVLDDPRVLHHHALAIEPPRGEKDLPPEDLPDISHVQASWEQELASLLRTWNGITADQVDQVVDQVRDVVAGGDPTGLLTLQVDSSDGIAALSDSMVALAATSAAQVVTEAKRQGTDTPVGHPDGHRLKDIASTVSSLLSVGLVLSAANEAVRTWGKGSAPEAVADGVRAHLDALTDAQPRLYLGSALTSAQNTGRRATLGVAPAGALYSSEVLDTNTCGPCRHVNGRWLGNTAGANGAYDPILDETYPVAGYIDCLGRQRCRGMVVGVWRPAQAESQP